MARRVALLAALALLVASCFAWYAATSASAPAQSCMHGESSIQAYRDAQGKIHVTKPVRTGC